jgi:hypothetical protein
VVLHDCSWSKPIAWLTCISNHDLQHELHPCKRQGFRWSWLPMQAEGLEPGPPSSAEQLYALQRARKEEQRMELERLGLAGSLLQCKRPQSSHKGGDCGNKRSKTMGAASPSPGVKTREQPKRGAATATVTADTNNPQCSGQAPPLPSPTSNLELQLAVDHGKPSKLLKLEFTIQGDSNAAFSLHALHDPIALAPGCTNLNGLNPNATLFVMREVWKTFLSDDVLDYVFKKDMDANTSTFLKRCPHALVKTRKSELATVKKVLPESIVGRRAREVLLGGVELVCAFLRHHGKGLVASHIEAQILTVVAKAMLERGLERGNTTMPCQDSESSSKGSQAAAPVAATRCVRHYGLSKAEVTPKLAQAFEAMGKYWTSDIVANREGAGAQLKEQTWQDRESMIKRFLGYCRQIHKLEPELELCTRVNLWTNYLEWLKVRSAEREGRKDESTRTTVSGDVSASGGVQLCAAAISVCKWLDKDNSKRGRNFRNIAHIEALRGMLCQCRTVANHVKRPDKDSDPYWVDLEDLDIARTNLENIVGASPPSDASKSTKLTWAQNFQDYLLCMMWTKVPPVRSQVVRSLRLLPLPHKSEASRLSWDARKDCYVMYFPHHKTGSKKKGAPYSDMIPLPKDVTGHINRYISEALPIKLAAASKPIEANFDSGVFLFLNSKGEFYGGSNFSGYIQQMWKRHLPSHKALRGHTIRKIMVTDLYNRPTTLSERLSWAATMGHSLKTQQEIYNLQSRTDLVAPAISDMNKQIMARAASAALKLQAVGVQPELHNYPSGSNAPLLVGAEKSVSMTVEEADALLWNIDKVVEIKSSKRGREVSQAKVQWAPSWVSAKSLSSSALDEANTMLSWNKRCKR